MSDKIKDEGLTCAYLLGKHDGIKQGRAEMYAEIKELAEKKANERCEYSSCDDCEYCCELQALEWLLEQLKEYQKEQK